MAKKKEESNIQKSSKAQALLNDICMDILEGLTKGSVHKMGDIWNHYIQQCNVVDVEIPPQYMSRKKTFHESVMKNIGDKGNLAYPTKSLSLDCYVVCCTLLK